MAWLTDATDPNQHIVDEVRTDTERMVWYSPMGVAASYERVVTTTRGRYKAMTYAAAVTQQAAINDPTGTPEVHASVRRTHVAGAYAVEYVSISRGAWS